MRILIFDGRFPTSHAKELAQRLRSEGHNVGFRNADRFTGHVERLAGRVYADSEEIRAAYASEGIETHTLTDRTRSGREHTRAESSAAETLADDEDVVITYEYAGNGRWTVYTDGKPWEKGRGKKSLQETLAGWSTSMDEAEDVTDA